MVLGVIKADITRIKFYKRLKKYYLLVNIKNVTTKRKT